MIVDVDEVGCGGCARLGVSVRAVRTSWTDVDGGVCCSVLGCRNLDWGRYGNWTSARVNHVPCHDDQLATLLPPLGNPMADIRLHHRDLRPAFRLRTYLCASLRVRV
jgi:hypothetical protein